MKFTIIKSAEKGICVPQIVFDNLTDVNGDTLKVLLYALQKDTADFFAISSGLNMNTNSVISALYFWCDKGLLHCEEEREGKKTKRASITSADIAMLLPSTPEIGELSKHIQKIFNYALNEKYINKFITLFVEDGIPVDVILQISAHCVGTGQDNPSYVIKVINSWYTKLGLKTGSSVDEYITLSIRRDELYKKVCKIFGLNDTKLTTSEKTIINSWFEKLKMSLDMVSESYIRAGHLANIHYCGGILKAWSQKGYSSPADLQGEISNITQSPRNIDSQDDLIMQGMKSVPSFDKSNAQKEGGKL
ncbi:MAG: DnaD domain protein [Oscillospiraceae bacterium]